MQKHFIAMHCLNRTMLRQKSIIADNLSKVGFSWGCGSAIDSNGQTIWIADAHRGDDGSYGKSAGCEGPRPRKK
ncbi:MAG: hypothetical protein DMF20_12090 [Verrucomicrobia bacterium]|nr:MAG: hypothetical protein DMF20_12090 [Verrucomicrobiota bacterium]